MNGATWGDRKTGWWLASNGRWYAPDSYPGGWSTTALPPAPEHRSRQSAATMITERTKRLRESVSEVLEDVADKTQSAGSGLPADGDPFHRSPPPPPPSGASRPGGPPRAPAGPRTASATVTSSASYSSRLPGGMPPPPALPAPDDQLPDPPGRFNEDARRGDDG